MAIDTKHPLYDVYAPEWVTMRDTYKGERAVKAKAEEYLPPTQGMRMDGMGLKQPGGQAYEAFKRRALFPEYVKEAVEEFIGLLHQKPPNITLPAQMEGMLSKATVYGESLQMLLRRINEEQLVTGRVGILLDLPATASLETLPHISLYNAEFIINWDDAEMDEGENRLNLVVLDETCSRMNKEFNWEIVRQYRVLQLGEIDQNEPEGTAEYRFGVFSEENSNLTYDASAMQAAMIRGANINRIPFVFVNSKDIVSFPDEPPLAGLAKLALAIYRADADYRQNLFMQGQDTLVIIGERYQPSVAEAETPIRTGVGAYIHVEQGGDAKYIGVDSQGLDAQRQALEKDHDRASQLAGKLLNNQSGTESGFALQTRISAQTATLNQIAITGAAALEKLLRMCAEWMGLNPDEVEVVPNLEFADYELNGDTLVKFMTARSMGAPLSKQSIHGLLVDRGITKMTYEDELEALTEEEQDDLKRSGLGLPGLPQEEVIEDN